MRFLLSDLRIFSRDCRESEICAVVISFVRNWHVCLYKCEYETKLTDFFALRHFIGGERGGGGREGFSSPRLRSFSMSKIFFPSSKNLLERERERV